MTPLETKNVTHKQVDVLVGSVHLPYKTVVFRNGRLRPVSNGVTPLETKHFNY